MKELQRMLHYTLGKKKEQELELELQKGKGTFILVELGDLSFNFFK